MKRRVFLSGLVMTAAGLVLPYEPKRMYSFPSRQYLLPDITLKRVEIRPSEGATLMLVTADYPSGRSEQHVLKVPMDYFNETMQYHIDESVGFYRGASKIMRQAANNFMAMDLRKLVT